MRIGPSATKLVLDLLLAVTAWRQSRRQRYDFVHSHEEAGVLGVLLARWLGVPHLYDMHSSLPQQLTNFRFARSRVLRWMFQKMEDASIFGSDVVVTICQDLQDHVEAMGAGERAVLIENVMGGDVEEPPTLSAASVRAQWSIDPAAPLVLYTGTFEAYQGLDMLLDAMAILARTRPAVRLLVVGGRAGAGGSRAGAAPPPRARRRSSPATSPRVRSPPSSRRPTSSRLRASGTNTPLKIYSYLRRGSPSSRPIC